nr:hypothetical protein [Tanacetum cinerariifolium]
EQKNLYKAMVDVYEYDKLILDTYGDTITLKRRRDDEDKNENPSTGSNRGSKRRRVGKEPESTSAPKEKTSKTSGKPNEGSKSQHKISSESAPAEEPMHSTQDFEVPTPQEFKTGATDDQPVEEASQHPHCNLAKKANSRTSFNELMDIPPLPLIPNSLGHRVIPFDHFINNDLEYLRGGASSRKYTTLVTKTKAADYGHIKWIKDLITVRRDDDKLYKFKEGNFKRLRIQDNEDMLLLLVQGKLTNLKVDELFAFNVSLQMFTRSIVIQRRVEDL